MKASAMRAETKPKATPATADRSGLLEREVDQEMDLAALRERHEAPARVELLERTFDMLRLDQCPRANRDAPG